MWLGILNNAQRFNSLDRNVRDASILFVLRLLIYTTITSDLYLYLNHGSYTILNITNFPAVATFLLGGQSLYCIALFLVVWQIIDVGLYRLWRLIFAALYELLIPVVQKVFLKNSLIFNEVIIRDSKHKRIIKGRNFEKYIAALKPLIKRSKEDYKAQLFDSFIVCILLYAVFRYNVYPNYHIAQANTIFVVALISSCYFHIHNYCLFRYAEEHAKETMKKLKEYREIRSNVLPIKEEENTTEGLVKGIVQEVQ